MNDQLFKNPAGIAFINTITPLNKQIEEIMKPPYNANKETIVIQSNKVISLLNQIIEIAKKYS